MWNRRGVSCVWMHPPESKWQNSPHSKRQARNSGVYTEARLFGIAIRALVKQPARGPTLCRYQGGYHAAIRSIADHAGIPHDRRAPMFFDLRCFLLSPLVTRRCACSGGAGAARVPRNSARPASEARHGPLARPPVTVLVAGPGASGLGPGSRTHSAGGILPVSVRSPTRSGNALPEPVWFAGLSAAFLSVPGGTVAKAIAGPAPAAVR